MDQEQRSQVRLIVEHEAELSRTEFGRRLKTLYADHASRGLLQSGGTIKAAIRFMEELTGTLITKSVDQAAAVAMDTEAFALVKEAVERFQTFLRNEVDGIVGIATGSSAEVVVGSAAHRAAVLLFEEQELRTTRQIEIHRFTFTKPTSNGKFAPIERRPEATRARGGRPLAPHWDQLWAAIAVQLYVGDLKPGKQADIENAMKDWLASQGTDVGDTAVRDRARVLWRAIEASD